MLQVTIPIAHELLGQCIKQGEALVQRASLVGDFSDYESWKAARKQWIDPAAQALEHIYGGEEDAREFNEAATCPESLKRWQEQYSADLRCVEEAIELLTVLRGELAFAEPAEVEAGPSDVARGELDRGETNGEASSEQSPAPLTIDAPGPAGSRGRSTEADDVPSGLAERVESSEQLGPGRAAQAPAVREAGEPSPHEDERAPARAVGAELATAQQIGAELAPQEAPGAPAETSEASAPSSRPLRTREVLLAHGRDERWAQAVEHLLEQAGEHEIRIVNRRAEHGRLAEVLGEDASARYAVVLLTADDVGGPRLESEAEPYFSTRAHQEVVFEMGFLVAALSPGCVCVLYEDGVELPYDLDGVSHVRLDLAGTWQPKLLLHLRRAGFDYDMNKLAA